MMPVAVGGLLSVLLSFLDVKNGMEIFLFSLKKIFDISRGRGAKKKVWFPDKSTLPNQFRFRDRLLNELCLEELYDKLRHKLGSNFRIKQVALLGVMCDR